jgi:hypothetical protein
MRQPKEENRGREKQERCFQDITNYFKEEENKKTDLNTPTTSAGIADTGHFEQHLKRVVVYAA